MRGISKQEEQQEGDDDDDDDEEETEQDHGKGERATKKETQPTPHKLPKFQKPLDMQAKPFLALFVFCAYREGRQ